MIKLKPVVNLIRDLATYDLVLVPLSDEIKRSKNLDVSVTKNDVDMSANCSVFTQDIPRNRGVHPRIYTNHGVSTTKGWGKAYNTDYYVVPSDFWADEIEAHFKNEGSVPYEIVRGIGWTKMDSWAIRNSRRDSFEELLKEEFDIEDDKKLIVFAPTYKKKSGWKKEQARKWSINQIMNKLRDIPDAQVIGSYHQMDDTRERDDDCFYFEGTTLVDLFLIADVVVADTGSLVYECAAMDIPLVLLDNPDYDNFLRIKAHTYDGVVDVGPRVTLKELPKAVLSQLDNPNEYKTERHEFGSMVAGPTDCRCSQRFVKFLEELIK